MSIPCMLRGQDMDMCLALMYTLVLFNTAVKHCNIDLQFTLKLHSANLFVL